VTPPTRISNQTARKIFLHHQGLGDAPTGPSKGAPLLKLIEQLGFVQVDSIKTVERAHHMILHARRQSYRPSHLVPLLERDRTLFEHWTHDAAIVPVCLYPHWQLRFERDEKHLRSRWKNWRRDGFEDQFQTVLGHIKEHGPSDCSDVGQDEKRGSGGWWDWHPSKTALEYLWRTGQLSVTRRQGFRKIYDLAQNVIPPTVRNTRPTQADTIDWACGAALDRLGFATSGEIAAFWDLVTPSEARTWCQRQCDLGLLSESEIENADGTIRRAWLRPTLDVDLPEMPGSVRILSPFDPALRDRKRAERLFGFHYRIEIFVPAAKRQFGYYVFPVLEGSNIIGRIDMKCDRPRDCLSVTAFWPEPNFRLGKGRSNRLIAAIHRTARFADAPNVEFAPDWIRG